MTRRRQQGLTLIEIALAIVVILVVGAFVFVQFSATAEAERTRRAVDLMQVLMAEARRAVPNRTYTGITAAILIRRGAVDEQYITPAGDGLLTPWLTAMNVSAADVGAGTANAMQIETRDIPSSACASMVRALSPGMDRVSVGGIAVLDRSAAIDNAGNLAAIATACGGTTQHVAWVPRA